MNYMPETLKMIGLELNEPFKIKNMKDQEQRYVTDTPIWFSIGEYGYGLSDNDRSNWYPMESFLFDILRGRYEIEKLPWKPKDGELYKCCFSDAAVGTTVWESSYIDYYRFNTGNCFKPDLETTLPLEVREKISKELKEIYG